MEIYRLDSSADGFPEDVAPGDLSSLNVYVPS